MNNLKLIGYCEVIHINYLAEHLIQSCKTNVSGWIIQSKLLCILKQVKRW